MKNKWIILIPVSLAVLSILMGCTKNETKYFADTTSNGLAIFSNTGNNILTGDVNGLVWRTQNRVTGGFLSRSTSEVYLTKTTYDSSIHLLVITWYGGTQNFQYGYDFISLYLSVPSNFSHSDLDSLNGKRLEIDSTKGYFLGSISEISNNYEIGTGSIYFNRFSYDPTVTTGDTGRLSGLLEADFPDFKFTNGRFDDELTIEQIQF
ncbi:MAG TPA: hypothetical protein VIJ75_01615 [Hanamia sp.]